MKSISLTSVALGLLLARVEASPAPVPADAGSKCSANNCLRAVRAGSFPNRPTAADCSSYLLATVTPAVHTETHWATITPVTETVSTTSTSIVIESKTETDRETVDVTTQYITTTITPEAIVVPTAKKRDEVEERQVTVVQSAQPAYASSCSTAGAYASACSCIGIFPSTTTVAIPTTVVTSTLTATASVTIGVTAIITETALTTVTETEARTATAQATVIATVEEPAGRGYSLRLLSDDPSINGKPVHDLRWPGFGEDSVTYLTIQNTNLDRRPVYTIDEDTSFLHSPTNGGTLVTYDPGSPQPYQYAYFFWDSIAGGAHPKRPCEFKRAGGHVELSCYGQSQWGYCTEGNRPPMLSLLGTGDATWCIPTRIVADEAQ